MGSPLGRVLANIFLCHHEKDWLNHCPDTYRPTIYKRYVDDIFVYFEKEDQVENFKNYFNKQHLNINFTSEKERNGEMPFLDVALSRTEKEILTSVYKKPTFTGIYCNYESFIPNEYKVGLVTTLLDRSFKIVSNYELLHKEVIKLKEHLKKNA